LRRRRRAPARASARSYYIKNLNIFDIFIFLK